MSEKVLFISSSLRARSNSEILAKEAEKGAKAAGFETEFLTLKDKDIQFCKGCLTCMKTEKCIIKDDVAGIIEKVRNADILVFATPIYYWGLSGQLKTLLDRMEPIYSHEYRFRKVYLMVTSMVPGSYGYKTTEIGLQGWVDCFHECKMAGTFSGDGVDLNKIDQDPKYEPLLKKAFEFGRNL